MKSKQLQGSVEHHQVNQHTHGTLRRKERKREKIFKEVMAEIFPNSMQYTHLQIQEAQKIPSRISPKRSTPRHIIIKLLKPKDKAKILKARKK